MSVFKTLFCGLMLACMSASNFINTASRCDGADACPVNAEIDDSASAVTKEASSSEEEAIDENRYFTPEELRNGFAYNYIQSKASEFARRCNLGEIYIKIDSKVGHAACNTDINMISVQPEAYGTLTLRGWKAVIAHEIGHIVISRDKNRAAEDELMYFMGVKIKKTAEFISTVSLLKITLQQVVLFANSIKENPKQDLLIAFKNNLSLSHSALSILAACTLLTSCAKWKIGRNRQATEFEADRIALELTRDLPALEEIFSQFSFYESSSLLVHAAEKYFGITVAHYCVKPFLMIGRSHPLSEDRVKAVRRHARAIGLIAADENNVAQ